MAGVSVSTNRHQLLLKRPASQKTCLPFTCPRRGSFKIDQLPSSLLLYCMRRPCSILWPSMRVCPLSIAIQRFMPSPNSSSLERRQRNTTTWKTCTTRSVSSSPGYCPRLGSRKLGPGSPLRTT